MKEKLKSITGNGLRWGLVFLGLSFILGYYFFNRPLQETFWMSLGIGLSALLINGLLYSRFSKPLKDLENISIEINNSETLLLATPANHLVEDSLIPGKLFLTNQRIIFKAYGSQGLYSQLISWDLAQIKPVDFSSSIWNSGGEFLLEFSEASLMFEVHILKPWKDSFYTR